MYVRVVELRRGRPLEGCADLPAVPRGDEVGAVGVVRGKHEQHRGVEHRADARVVRRSEVVQEVEGGEGAAHLGRVDRVGHGHDGLAFVDETLGVLLAETAGVREPCVHPPDRLEPRVVRLGRRGHQDEGAALGRLPDLLHADTVRGRVEGFEVRKHLPPVGELPVRAGHEPQDRLRRGDGGSA
jgi:hypothetical protein